MTSGAPWSVKGIDPKAREVAKDLARRSGMTLGEWLNHMILEDESPEDVFSEAQLTARSTRTYYETPRGRDAAPSRYEVPEHPGDEIGRVIRALDRLTERIESSETQTGLAIGGVEQSVREALARIEAAERDQVAVSARFEGAVEEVAASQAKLSERFRRMENEAAGPRSAEALRSLEQALGKVANHLYEGETRTRSLIEAVEARVERIEAQDVTAAMDPSRLIDAVVDRIGARLADAESRTASALEGLRESFASLDKRLNVVEGEGAQANGSKFEELAANLTARVEAARVDIAERLRASSEGRFDRIERSLGEVVEQVRVAEQGSAQAIERMGREVMTMADTLTRRVQGVEDRSAEAIEQVGGEMARIAQAMESRLARTDTVHAEALEKLGGEITRITERLAERIGAAERRSAQAVDDVLEQVSRSNERATQRHERASEDLAERIRQSEERTARLLAEARATIDQSLAETQKRIEATRAPAVDNGFTRFAPDPLVADPLALGPPEPDAPAEASETPDAFAAYAAFASPRRAAAFDTPAGFKTFAEEAPFPRADEPAPFGAAQPAFGAEDLEAAEAFTPIPEPGEDEFAPELAGGDEPPAEQRDALTSAPSAEPATAEEEEVRNLPEVDALNSALAILEASRARVSETPISPPEEETAAEETEQATFFAEEFTQEDDSPPALERQTPAFAFTAADLPREAEETESEPEVAAADPLDRLEALETLASEESFEIRTPSDPPDVGSAPEQARPLTTREVVEQARAAARAAAQASDGKRGKVKSEKAHADGGLFSGLGIRPKRRAGSTLQIALMLTGGAAALGVATAGFVLDSRPDGKPPQRVADALALADQEVAAPRAAVALAPSSVGEPPLEAAADPSQNLAGLYAEALRAVEAGEPEAAEGLKRVASLGYPRAQFHLAKLYETGEAGLKKNLTEARRWTERAARGGDREAMHNFALQQFFGDGGPKDPLGAAEWFRKAADLGLVDSQYNLARLYEDGVGVTRNAAEAYKWYLIAAKSGDPDSKQSARRMRALLSPDAQNVTERAAASFRSAMPGSGAPAPARAAGEAAASVATAQQALSRLGYYQGPTDGAPSPALQLAVQAYQRDQGLAATGALDPTTVSRLAVFTR